jgi:hypothetical protein
VDESPARTVLLVVDACREGLSLGPTKSVGLANWGRGEMGRAARRGFVTVFGCSPGQVCRYTAGADGFSLFSRALALGIGQMPRTINDLLTAAQNELNALCAREKMPAQKVYQRSESAVGDNLLDRPIRHAPAPPPAPTPTPPLPTPPASKPVPFLAPPRPRHDLVGRAADLKELKRHLVESGDRPTCVAQGLPGVGKTSVAVALAHDPQAREHFADGVLWVGLGRTPDVPALLGGWAAAVGLSAEEVARLGTAADRAKAVRDAIGGRRMLLVIDDALAGPRPGRPTPSGWGARTAGCC